MNRDEWMQRYARRMSERLGILLSEGMAFAEAATDLFDADPDESPEDAADEELTYWEAE